MITRIESKSSFNQCCCCCSFNYILSSRLFRYFFLLFDFQIDLNPLFLFQNALGAVQVDVHNLGQPLPSAPVVLLQGASLVNWDVTTSG